MSKKKLNIALLILVFGLWGTVGYKAVSQYIFSKEIALNEVQSNAEFNFSQIKKDTFSIGVIQRDPFLNKISEQKTQVPLVKKTYSAPKIIMPPIIKAPIMWPSVSYYGYIKSKEKTEELILVKIDNKLYRLRKNAQVDGLFIKKVFNDSLEVVFNKEKRMIVVGK